MGRYSHLTIGEREEIMCMRREGRGVGDIARAIGRDKSTVSRELARNPCGRGARCEHYRASTAQRRYGERRARCRRPRLLDDPERRALVRAKVLEGRWSPEQLEGRIALERPGLAVSDTTIYREIRSGRLDRLIGGGKASARLRRGGRRRRRGDGPELRGRIKVSHEVSERPPEADARSRVGDWEGDTVAGRAGGPCLVTMVDRLSGYLAGGKAPSRRRGASGRPWSPPCAAGPSRPSPSTAARSSPSTPCPPRPSAPSAASACRTTRGSGGRTRTPTACSASTSRSGATSGRWRTRRSGWCTMS